MKKNETLWLNGTTRTSYPVLLKDIQADACVIGGGFSGLLTGYLLQKQGVKTVLLESEFIGFGVSGHTTAHVTSMLDNYYHEIISSHGMEESSMLADATRKALDLLKEISETHGFQESYERVPVYYYADGADHQEVLQKEKEAITQLGFQPEDDPPGQLPFIPLDMFKIPDQACLHATEYLQGLAAAFVASGGSIYESTKVDDFEFDEGENWIVKANGHTISAKNLLQCTHTPLQFNPVQMKLKPYTSYVMVGKPAKDISPGLYYDLNEPYHYTRTFYDQGGQLLIIGGFDTKSGEPVNNKGQMEQLKAYAADTWGVRSALHQWGAMFFEPADTLPYIGKDPLRPQSFIATGYSGDGIMFATIGAMLNSELVVNDSHPWQRLFSPSRLKLESIPDIVQEGLGVTKHLLGDRFSIAEDDVQDIKPGEGKVLRREGEKIGASRDTDNKLYLVDPVCPHMKCIVKWNNLSHTWDCGCHGSRYDHTGRVVSGPSTRDLGKIAE